MARKIIVTVGVSLIREEISDKEAAHVGFENLQGGIMLNTLRKLQDQLRHEDDRKRQNADYRFDVDYAAWVRARGSLVQAITALWQGPASEKKKRRLSGAELASLRALQVGEKADYRLLAEDEIILMASDTPSGEFCAKLIAEVLSRAEMGLPKFAHVRVERIVGLRPDSVETFVAQGLPNAARLLNAYARNAILIGSGGYKGLLPYLGPVAMHLGVPLFYLYEDSEELLELQPLPVQFDLAIITAHLRVFEPIYSRRAGIRATDFWQALQDEAGHDFNAVQQQIRTLGIIEEQELGTAGQAVVKLTATGVLSYILATQKRQPVNQDAQRPLLV